jgi:hypothetical protein
MTQGAVALSGEWADPSCNAGTLYLERATEPKLPLAGVRSGVLNERGTQSRLTLEFNQDGAVVHGQAIIRHFGDTGTIALKGYLGGSNLYIEEQELLTTSGPAWCLKSLAATYSANNSRPTLTGTWASGCGQGSFSLTKQDGR